jgi:hypothetical protein
VAVQQDISHRAPADRGDHADDGDSEPVESLPARGEGAADREDGDPEKLKNVANAAASAG